MGWLAWTMLGLVLLFTHQSLTHQIAEKHGHKGMLPGFIGLIPVFGLIYYLKIKTPVRPPIKEKSNRSSTLKTFLAPAFYTVNLWY